jgi:ligand-binding sensor domain-containing protein/signal transduction histidine kinase
LITRGPSNRAYFAAPWLVLLGVSALPGAAATGASAAFVDAAGFVAQSWQVEDGLPQGSVMALVQARDGDLWFGTQNGLVRFDGLTFKVYGRHEHPALGGNFVRALCEGRDGGLWVGTSRGLARVVDGVVRSVPGLDRERHDWSVTALAEDPRGLWIGTAAGLARMVNDRVEWLDAPHGPPPARVNALLVTSDGTLWAGTAAGLWRLGADGARSVFDRSHGLPDEHVTALALDLQGRLWAAARSGAPVVLDPEGRRFGGAPVGWPDEAGAQALTFDRQGGMWAGTRVGLVGLSAGRVRHWRAGQGLTDDHVLSLLEDREGSLWIGTERRGLNRFKRPRLHTLAARDGLPEDTVLAVHEDGAGALWLGTWHGVTRRLPDGTLRTFGRADGLAGEEVIALADARDGGVWIGHMRGGLSKLVDGRATVIPLPRADVPVLALHEDADGRLWIGTGDGLYSLRGGSFTRYGRAQGLPADAVYRLLPTRAGGLWIGTRDGLARLDEGHIRRVEPFRGALADCILALLEDADGTLWVGTCAGGLGRLRDGRLSAYTALDGLPDAVVYEVVDDQAGSLWLTSNRGLAQLRRADVADFDARRVPRLRPTLFGRGDGLRQLEFSGGSQPTGLRARDGRLWFATVGGAVLFDPRHLSPALPEAPARLLKVLVDRVALDVGPGAGASQKPSRGDLEFHFSARTLAAPEKVRFRYRLNGFDDDWHEVDTQRSATYTNVPPGRYRFEVQATGDGAAWLTPPAAFDLTLRPQFHQTAWFRALPLLVVALAAWGLHQRRKRRFATQAAVLAERHRLASELHDGLAQGLSGLIRQLEALRGELPDVPPQILERLARALDLARGSLSDARRSVRALRPPELTGSTLAEGLAVAAHQLTAGAGVRLEVQVTGTPCSLPPEAEQHLFRAGQEALSNAVRHAQASVIRLSVAFRRRSVRVTVSDDGRGLGAATSAASGGVGLGAMRERMRLAGGELRLVSRAGRGTEVIAILPLEAKAAAAGRSSGAVTAQQPGARVPLGRRA